MDDRSVIERCLNGEKEAFGFFVENYQRQAVAHAVAILGGNREDALDAAQEAFIDAYKALKTFDRTRKFYPWFYVLLRHRCYKMMARKSESESVEEIEIFAAAPGMPNEEKFALEKALRELSPENREAITLKYLDGFSYDELAEHLKIPKGTVMSRLYHARRQLQAKLTGKFNQKL